MKPGILRENPLHRCSHWRLGLRQFKLVSQEPSMDVLSMLGWGLGRCRYGQGQCPKCTEQHWFFYCCS